MQQSGANRSAPTRKNLSVVSGAFAELSRSDQIMMHAVALENKYGTLYIRPVDNGRISRLGAAAEV
jgi:hypothetical protein